MNSLILVGRLTKDPELRYIPGAGTAVASFTIAVDRDFVKRDGTKDTDFIPCEVMGKPAEYIASYVVKGSLVEAHGYMRVDRYQDKNTGENKTFTKAQCSKVHVWAKPNKTENVETQEPVKEQESYGAVDFDDVPF